MLGGGVGGMAENRAAEANSRLAQGEGLEEIEE